MQDSEDSDFEAEADDVELSSDTAEKVDIDDFLRHEDDDGGRDYGDDYYGNSDTERGTAPVRVETSFHDYVLDQLGMLELDERSHAIAEQVIGSMDEDGYLRREITALADDLAFGQNIHTTPEEVNDIIQQIQQFDPPVYAHGRCKNVYYCN